MYKSFIRPQGRKCVNCNMLVDTIEKIPICSKCWKKNFLMVRKVAPKNVS